ncbi:MAG: regulatory protein RecX [Deltaproteobacteria bacterium]|nr:regulatory protein RecX [Deltaproteobacteria bacterium]
MAQKTKRDALSTAYKLLSYRQRSVMELSGKLEAKGFVAEEIGPVIDYLKEAGFLDDGKFASELAASRVKYKNWGPIKISAELESKGISREIIEAAFAPLKGGFGAEAALNKWIKENRAGIPLDKRTRERAFRFLKGRGFTADSIMKAINFQKPEEP